MVFIFQINYLCTKKIKNLQNSLRLSNQVICLPFFFDLDEKMIKKIIETLKVCLKK